MNVKKNSQFQLNEERMTGAFLELMNENSFGKMTVDLICKEVGLNRSTFCFHFSDKYMLFEKAREFVGKELCVTEGEFSDAADALLSLVKKYPGYYMYCCSTDIGEPDTDLLCAEGLSEKEKGYLLNSYADAFKGILKRWIESGFEDDADAIRNVLQAAGLTKEVFKDPVLAANTLICG